MLVEKPNATIPELMTVCPGPDFPTGGLILGTKGPRSAFETGRGSVVMQARATIEPMDGGRQAILITELPYQVNKATLVENIAAMHRDKKIDGISDLRDESDRNGMRIVIELRRDANANVILNSLYKHTQLRTSFGVINLSVVDGTPRVLNLKETLEFFIAHRQDVITRRSRFQLKKAEARAHILEGFRAILASIDDVIALIRGSESREDARHKLMNVGVPNAERRAEMVTLSEIQANAVLDMRLGQLTQLDRMKIDDEYNELVKEIERLRGILGRRAQSPADHQSRHGAHQKRIRQSAPHATSRQGSTGHPHRGFDFRRRCHRHYHARRLRQETAGRYLSYAGTRRARHRRADQERRGFGRASFHLHDASHSACFSPIAGAFIN